IALSKDLAPSSFSKKAEPFSNDFFEYSLDSAAIVCQPLASDDDEAVTTSSCSLPYFWKSSNWYAILSPLIGGAPAYLCLDAASSASALFRLAFCPIVQRTNPVCGL